jgi:formate dehydrogenase subunit gamma
LELLIELSEMPAEHEALVEQIIVAHRGREGAALPILHAVQEALGYIPDSAIPLIAKGLNISRAEMHGVVTFYHDFRREPAGRHVVKLCRAEACQSAGAHAVAERIRQRLAIGFGETSPDGRVTLEAVYCLGLCATAPSAMVDGKLMGRLDAAGADRIVAEVNR